MWLAELNIDESLVRSKGTTSKIVELSNGCVCCHLLEDLEAAVWQVTCMHVCTDACVHVCTSACVHVSVYACMQVCMYARMYVCMYVYTYMHTYIRAYMHTCIHAYTLTCTHADVHTCTHASVHTCIHVTCHTAASRSSSRWQHTQPLDSSTILDVVPLERTRLSSMLSSASHTIHICCKTERTVTTDY